MTILQNALSRIQPLDPLLLKQAEESLDRKTKPIGSLGRLEEFARRFAAITGSLRRIPEEVIYTRRCPWHR